MRAREGCGAPQNLLQIAVKALTVLGGRNYIAPMGDKSITAALVGALLFSFTACGGRLYKVSPLPTNAQPDVTTSNGNGLNVGAMALDGEQSYERFEANLPLAGVIAIE